MPDRLLDRSPNNSRSMDRCDRGGSGGVTGVRDRCSCDNGPGPQEEEDAGVCFLFLHELL